MSLRVREVIANLVYRGAELEEQINARPSSCKNRFGLGKDVCGIRECTDCFNTFMINIEREDRLAQEQQDKWNEDDGCADCNGENCESCEGYDEWSDN